MTVHAHTWSPIPLECGRYECPCGATGYRNGYAIVEHRTQLPRRQEVTVRSRRETSGAVPAYRYHDTGARNR